MRTREEHGFVVVDDDHVLIHGHEADIGSQSSMGKWIEILEDDLAKALERIKELEDTWFTDGKPVTDLDFALAEARLWKQKAKELEKENEELWWYVRELGNFGLDYLPLGKLDRLDEMLRARFPEDKKRRDEPFQNHG